MPHNYNIIQGKRVFTERPASRFIRETHPSIDCRDQKNKARGRILGAIINAGFKKLKCLTLPGPWWSFEKDLIKISPRASCVGIERSRRLFNAAAHRIPKSNKSLKALYSEECDGEAITNGKGFCLIHGDIHCFLRAENKHDQRFNFVWLDLHQQINDNLLCSLKHLPGRLCPESIVAITVMAGRESVKITELMERDRLGFIKNRLGGHFNGRIIDTYRYHDKRGATMIQAIYRTGWK